MAAPSSRSAPPPSGIHVQFLGHSTNVIDVDGVRVLTDPLLRQRVAFLARIPDVPAPTEYESTDIVLISHLHHDHCDIASIKAVNAPVVIVPANAGEFLYRRGIDNLVELEVGASVQFGDVVVTAVPAAHDGSRISSRGMSSKLVADAIGFVLTGPSGSVYFAGDTDVFSDMSSIASEVPGGLDLAILPVWGWGPNLGPGHMDPRRAVDALELLEPDLAIPIHWGTYFPIGLRGLRPKFASSLVEPPKQFAQLAKQSGLTSAVRVLQPGSGIAVSP